MSSELVLCLVQCAVTYGFIQLVWKTCRRLIASHSLSNIPGPTAESFLTGTMLQLHNLDRSKFQRELTDLYEPVVRIRGVFGSNHLFVYDPLALHHIVVKDQHIYNETFLCKIMSGLIHGEGLLSASGARHRKQRKVLNSALGTSQIRQLHPVFCEIAYKLRETIASNLTDGPNEIDMFHWLSRTALEPIGQGGLGHSFDPLTGDVQNSYADALKSLLTVLNPVFPFCQFLPFLFTFGFGKFRRWLVEHMLLGIVQNPQKIIDCMDESNLEILNTRKLAVEKEGEAGLSKLKADKDVLSALLKANMATSEADRFSEDEVLGQISTLVFGGTDTTSSALSRTLSLLAEHPDVQEKLRAKIVKAHRGRSDIPYDELSALPYLDAVCRETLRLFPPMKHMAKIATQDVVMPLSAPIKGVDGTPISEIFVPEGTNVYVGILASNCNPALWGKDAREWIPDRWLAPLPEALIEAHIPGVYANLMTFLRGSRSCVGFKFSQLEMKVMLAVLLEAFTFAPSAKPIF